MKIAYNASLPPPRQPPQRAPASTGMVVRPGSGGALKKANAMPKDQGVEGELLKGRGRAFAVGGEERRGQTYRGDCLLDGAASGRRAVSAYLYHARLTSGSRAHVIDVYA